MQKRISPAFYVVAIGYSLIALVPFLWSIYTSFKPTSMVYHTWVPLKDLSFGSYKYLFTSPQVAFVQWLLNSIIVAIIVTVGNLIVNTLAGYAFARLKLPGKGPLFLVFLAVMMIPGQVIMVPMYMLLGHLGWIGNYSGLTIPFLMSPFMIFLARQFFLGMPKELEEAARVDGLGTWGIFLKIFLPMARPLMATQIIFTFQGNWNSLMWPSLLTTGSPNVYTLPVGLNSLYGQYNGYWNNILAGVLLLTIPMIIIFFIFQRQFVQGMATSGIK
ncbi:carbohydrate ABC transporter permease [Alicyclobacillus acidiphilus]|uniref:carbohydrate ABC transporter permease n=1 Tax=Alicyclobacillus acidiphilus TaxID=182455 RepID=UPI0008373A7B|nr:carbohydrate ABC transporter permease [Alicyclobacillus acidiphilus]